MNAVVELIAAKAVTDVKMWKKWNCTSAVGQFVFSICHVIPGIVL